MYKEKTILAIIPARAGSKRFKGKNIKMLAGIPLIAWTIEEALKSKYLDRIIVSTDNEDIALTARRYGAEAPFIRPKKLARDNSKMIDAIFHAVAWMAKNKNHFDMIMLLQPTSPLRRAGDIDKAIKLLFSRKAQAVVSVCEAEHNPHWARSLPQGGCMKDFLMRKNKNCIDPGAAKFYRLNGAIYLAYRNYLLNRRDFFGARTFAYIMPRERSVDIDTAFDFEFAEYLLKKRCPRA